MKVAHGEAIVTRLQAFVAEGLLRTAGWASEVSGTDDITLLCPAAWVQPGPATFAERSGRSGPTRLGRIWVVVICVAGDGSEPLEPVAGEIAVAAREALNGLQLGAGSMRRLHYQGEPEPYYARGYIELPMEFEAHEHVTGGVPPAP